MGLFSSKTKIYVSSVVYNLAGPEEDRPNYLKTLVLGSAIRDNNIDIAQTIKDGYLGGPGIRLRSFARWGRTSGYNDMIGLNNFNPISSSDINNTVVADQIPKGTNQTIQVQRSSIGFSDYTYWAEQWMMVNRPNEIDTDWLTTIDDETNEITITLVNGQDIKFMPDNYEFGKKYLYVAYNKIDNAEIQDLVPGTVHQIGESPFPSTTGWVQEYFNTEVKPIELTTRTKVDKTFSDNRPPESQETETTEMGQYTETHGIYTKDEYLGRPIGGSYTQTERSIQYQNQLYKIKNITTVVETQETIEGGVVVDIKTTTIKQTVVVDRNWRTDTQITINSTWLPMELFIYKEGGGNPVLDAMFTSDGNTGTYFPYVPLRVDNRFISDSYYEDIFKVAPKAVKKSTGGSFSKIMDSVADNENLGDIDYAYIVFGVSMNVKENACKKYIYKTFERYLVGTNSWQEFQDWIIKYEEAHESTLRWIEWYEAQDDPQNPLWGGNKEPYRIPYPPKPTHSLNVSSPGRPDLNYNSVVAWNYIKEEFGTGQLSGMKVGELKIELGNETSFPEYGTSTRTIVFFGRRPLVELDITWQESKNSWRKLTIGGLEHWNNIYGGKSVWTTIKEAMNDPDESGFIIPLHEDIYKSMSLIDTTQMSTACSFIVFNCYEEVKKKWYQSGFFKVVVIIAIIVIAVYTGGFGAGGAGLLGTNAAIGATLGFTGTVAIIAGAAANAIAAMILTKVITDVSRAVLGDKVGIIVGTIASIAAVQIGTAMMNGVSLSTMMGQMVSAEKLLMLTSTSLGAVNQYMEASMKEIVNDTNRVLEEYKIQSMEIQRMYEENIGYGRGMLDPLTFTDSVSNRSFTIENPDSFFSRTLMTGSDIAQASFDMINNFVEITTDSNPKL